MAKKHNRLQGGQGSHWLQLSLGLVGSLLILAARKPDAFANPQFWAEDAYFFERNYTLGFSAFFLQYNGYLHLIPRLIAWLSSWLDPLRVPAGFVGLSLLCTLYIAGLTFSARHPFKRSLVYLFPVVLIPDAGEVLLNPTNLQSILVAGLVLILISRDATSGWQMAHDAIALVLIGLTGPHVVVLAPMFAFRAFVRKSRYSLILALLVSGLAITQGSNIFSHPLPAQSADLIHPEYALPVVGLRIFSSVFFGGHITSTLPISVTSGLGVLTVLLVTILAARPGPCRRERVLLALSFVALVAATLFRMRFALESSLGSGFGSRYYYTPQLLVVWLLVTALGDTSKMVHRVSAVILMVSLIANVARLRENPMVDLNWELYADRIRNHERVVVPVNPVGWNLPLNTEK